MKDLHYQECPFNYQTVELMGKKEFAATVLDLEHETYIVHVGSVSFDASSTSSPLKFDVHHFYRPQIFGLIVKKAPTKVPDKYIHFANIFSPDLASKQPKYTGINNHAIELVDGQQLFYGPIYSPGPVEVETLKAYIKTNLVNGFIRPSKSLASIPILFD